jgi:hypothetical protein
VVAEDALVEHLAELVLSLHEALLGSLAYPTRSFEEVGLALESH